MLRYQKSSLTSLDQMHIPAQQVEDAATLSIIANLGLPLLLNLILVALFTEGSANKLLAYILLSDLLTVVPIGIKVVELLLIHRARYRSGILRITSPSPISELGERNFGFAAEGIWASEC